MNTDEKLKTLKDFTDKECYCWFPPFFLEDKCKKKRAIPEDLLKAEAVKWVKKENITYAEEGFAYEDIDSIKSFISFFFNLTEENCNWIKIPELNIEVEKELHGEMDLASKIVIPEGCRCRSMK